MNPMNDGKANCIRPSYGFRFSALDAVVLMAAFAATAWLKHYSIDLWWVLPMVVLHFFLFCNVFMVWRKYELIWAAIFVTNVAVHVLVFDNFNWWPACLLQFPVTLLIIIIQMRSPWYHGVGAKYFNPKLDEYLTGNLKRPKNT